MSQPPHSLQDIRNIFELFCKESEYILNQSPYTINWYKRTVGTFLKHNPHIKTMRDLEGEDMERFLYNGIKCTPPSRPNFQ